MNRLNFRTIRRSYGFSYEVCLERMMLPFALTLFERLKNTEGWGGNEVPIVLIIGFDDRKSVAFLARSFRPR